MTIMTTSTQALQQTLLDQICEAWLKLQQQQPLVHIMTNTVASNYVANIVLAAHASPAMIDNPFEAESFAKIASSNQSESGYTDDRAGSGDADCCENCTSIAKTVGA